MKAMPKFLKALLLSVTLIGVIIAGAFLRHFKIETHAQDQPVQHNGRVKPFDSFARQTVKLVTGSASWQKKPAADVMTHLLADPAEMPSMEWIRIDYEPLKNTLSLGTDGHFFSQNDLSESRPKIEALVQAAKAKRDNDVRPSMVEQKAEQLYTKLRTLEELEAGRGFERLDTAQASSGRLKAEVLYNKKNFFHAAAIFYFLGFLVLSVFGKFIRWKELGFALVGAALALHTAGLGLRIFILSRPPVSNMYESMIFMNWALIIFAVIFSWVRRNEAALGIGALVSGLVMVYASLLPIDASLEVLVPVLRSNYWLSIHVMTVVSSYGAFGLAMGLSHAFLVRRMRGNGTKTAEAESAELIYKVIQLGTLLIGTGTVLGGVWANESWGRFWGWDPKETWALITFLGYLVVIHLRFAKKISDFGIAIAGVLGFLLVLMTWYGVNFVLGRGLHSYGAGSGGMRWVVYYLLFEAGFLAWIMARGTRRSSR